MSRIVVVNNDLAACEERDTHEVEFLEMVRVTDQEIKKKKKGEDINLLQCFLPEVHRQTLS